MFNFQFQSFFHFSILILQFQCQFSISIRLKFLLKSKFLGFVKAPVGVFKVQFHLAFLMFQVGGEKIKIIDHLSPAEAETGTELDTNLDVGDPYQDYKK